MCDLPHLLPGLTGKIELVFEGEQEGSVKISKALVGKAVREIFRHYFPDPLQKPGGRRAAQTEETPKKDAVYSSIIRWFEQGNTIEVADDMPVADYNRELEKVNGLRDVTLRFLTSIDTHAKAEVAAGMEFVLDGLHQNSKIAKEETGHSTAYKDMVGSIFTDKVKNFEED
jgi:magnesium chelatase subunit I